MGDRKQMSLISELAQGRELVKQLQVHLNVSTSSHEARELLVHRILNSYDKALSMLKWDGQKAESQPGAAVVGRKTKRVEVCPLDDGYGWKQCWPTSIRGAKYPTNLSTYYRCTYWSQKRCRALKREQRSDKDPTVFEITYIGSHTCTPGSHPTLAPTALPQNQEPIATVDHSHNLISPAPTALPQNQEPIATVDHSHNLISPAPTALPQNQEPIATVDQSHNFISRPSSGMLLEGSNSQAFNVSSSQNSVADFRSCNSQAHGQNQEPIATVDHSHTLISPAPTALPQNQEPIATVDHSHNLISRPSSGMLLEGSNSQAFNVSSSQDSMVDFRSCNS